MLLLAFLRGLLHDLAESAEMRPGTKTKEAIVGFSLLGRTINLTLLLGLSIMANGLKCGLTTRTASETITA